MKFSARTLAIDTCVAWEKQRQPLDLLFEKQLAKASLPDPRDRQLALALINGTVRWRGSLDFVISKFSKQPLRKIKPQVRAALRIGVYQLLFMDRIPPAIAINESVQALRDLKQPKWITGFANGVLRSLNRELAMLPAIDELAEFCLDVPDWLRARWESRYGHARCKTLCRAGNELPPLTLRLRGDDGEKRAFCERLRKQDIEISEGIYAPDAVMLQAYRGCVHELPGYDEGRFWVQDEAAQLAVYLLAPFAGGLYLDACAGLGGKTMQMHFLLGQNSQVVAVEPSVQRFQLLQENCKRLHLNGLEPVQASLQNYAQTTSQRFDGIFLDAPCSGLGVIRRQPDIKWQRTDADLKKYQKKQLELLDAAAPLLKNKGILVYATCSTEPEENQEVINVFLENHLDFTVSNAQSYLPESAKSLADEHGFFRPLPDQGVDGFFAARLQRKS